MENLIYINKERTRPSDSFMVHHMGIHEIMPPKFVNRPMGTDSFLAVFFYTPVTLSLKAKQDSYPKNIFMFWPPHCSHYFGALDHRWDHSWFYWDGKVITRLLSQCGVPMNRPVPFNQPDVVDRYLIQIHDELSGHLKPDQIIVQNHLHTLFRVIRRVLEGEKQIDPVPNQLLKIRRFLNMNIHTPVTLSQISQSFCISVPHLCSQFRKYFGVSPIEYLIQLRMQQAVNLMYDCEMTICQIAEKVGYPDPYHFSKTFKKHYGLSPRHYRAKAIYGKSNFTLGRQ